jgi:predicted transposase YbfD/YdcC
MATAQPASILTHFASLTDPRMQRCRLHNLLDMVVIALCAVLCGCDDWVDVANYGRKKQAWLKTFLPLPHGIPSHDTFSRVFARLDPQEFQRCFVRWIEALRNAHEAPHIAIDGKTLRHSFDTAAGQSPLQLLTAWAGANHLVLGQLAVDPESNELGALPDLLRLLDLDGALVTLDAMGCQKQVVEEICDQGGDYVITLKANQDRLHDDVQSFFTEALDQDFVGQPHRYQKTQDQGHGRREARHYYVSPVPEAISRRHGWRGLRSIGMVYAERQVGDAEPSGEPRYFISSLRPQVKAFAKAVRGHWGIENSLHWVLDVTFAEDQCRIRKDHGPANFALLRRMAVSFLNSETTTKASLKSKRKMAGWDNEFLLNILLGISND